MSSNEQVNSSTPRKRSHNEKKLDQAAEQQRPSLSPHSSSSTSHRSYREEIVKTIREEFSKKLLLNNSEITDFLTKFNVFSEKYKRIQQIEEENEAREERYKKLEERVDKLEKYIESAEFIKKIKCPPCRRSQAGKTDYEQELNTRFESLETDLSNIATTLQSMKNQQAQQIQQAAMAQRSYQHPTVATVISTPQNLSDNCVATSPEVPTQSSPAIYQQPIQIHRQVDEQNNHVGHFVPPRCMSLQVVRNPNNQFNQVIDQYGVARNLETQGPGRANSQMYSHVPNLQTVEQRMAAMRSLQNQSGAEASTPQQPRRTIQTRSTRLNSQVEGWYNQ